MADPTLVLLVLLAGPRGGEPMDDATVGTAVREALGRETRVLVDPGHAQLADDDATATAARIHADAVATIAWVDERRTSARVHMFVTADNRFYDRELTFQPADDRRERERAVGFLVGAMVRAAQSEQEARVEAPPVVVTPAPREPPPPPPPPVAPRDVVAPPPPVAAPPRSAPRRALAIEAAAAGSAGVGGAALGVGPQLAIAWYPWARVALRASGSALFGAIPHAGAASIATRITAGASYRAWSFGAGSRGSIEIGVAAVAVDHRVRRDDPPATRDRWIGGAQLGLRGGWQLSELVEVFASMTGELVAGNTPLVVGTRTEGQIPPGRALAGAGIALKF